jgi:transposase-like protein
MTTTSARGGALAAKAAAEYIGTTEGTLGKWRYELRTTGQSAGPPFTKIGSKVVYRRETLDAWLAQREQQTMASLG